MTPPMTPREKVASLKTNDPTNPAHRLARDLQAQRYASLEARDDMADVLLEREAILAENAVLRAERRNIVSHATMGDTDGEGLSVNEISIRITALRNEMHSRATEAERKLAEAVGLLRRIGFTPDGKDGLSLSEIVLAARTFMGANT